MRRRSCVLVKRQHAADRKGSTLRPETIANLRTFCGCEDCERAAKLGVLTTRRAELEAEVARIVANARTCPGCGCTRALRCAIAVRDADGSVLAAGVCAAAGELPGHETCSACLTPEHRVSFGGKFVGVPTSATAMGATS